MAIDNRPYGTGTFVAPAQPRPGEAALEAALVVLTFALAMIAAWLLKDGVQLRTAGYTSPDGQVSVAYPASWFAAQGGATPAGGSTLLDVYDPESATAFPARFQIQRRPVPAGSSLAQLRAVTANDRDLTLQDYRELSSHEVTLGGHPAIQVSYGYVASPPPGAGPATLPIVAQATDELAIDGGQLLTFTSMSDASAGPATQSTLERIWQSVRLK